MQPEETTMKKTYVVRTRGKRPWYFAAPGVPGLVTKDPAEAFVMKKKVSAVNAARCLRGMASLSGMRVFRRKPRLWSGHERAGA